MLDHQDTTLIRRLSQSEALIIKKDHVDLHPAYAKGDRRKRPALWVSQDSFARLQSMGGLASRGHGFMITKSLANRVSRPDNDSYAQQHRNMEEREIYLDSGVRRPARFNTALSPLDRLARRTDKAGNPLLSKAEYEAGQRFARDYALAGYDRVATQNYMNAGEDKSAWSNREEDIIHTRMEARRHHKAAREAMGVGLDTAVIAVCCLDQNLAQVERAENWVVASGLTILKMGLGRLAALYGTSPGEV